MPKKHESVFRIWHHECDAEGILRPAVFLRYCQESAYDASAAVGFGMTNYAAADRSWYIRETNIEYLSDMRYGQEVVVRTWVEDFHRVRSIRKYEVFRREDMRLVAEAWSDWVFIIQSTGQPCTIPVEIIQACYPEWVADKMKQRTRFPAPGKAISSVYQEIRRVDWRDLDPAAHVNNAALFDYVLECARRANLWYGLQVDELKDLGLVERICSAHLEYRKPVFYNAELKLSSWISLLEGGNYLRHVQIMNLDENSIVVQAHLRQAFVDTRTRKPVPIPDSIALKLAPNKGGEGD